MRRRIRHILPADILLLDSNTTLLIPILSGVGAPNGAVRVVCVLGVSYFSNKFVLAKFELAWMLY